MVPVLQDPFPTGGRSSTPCALRKFILPSLLAAVLASNGCYYDSEEALYPDNFCDTVSVTFSGSIEPIIQAKCLGCHSPGAQEAVDLTVFANVAEEAASGRLLRSVKRDPSGISMPPGVSLGPCEVRKFELWLASGANND